MSACIKPIIIESCRSLFVSQMLVALFYGKGNELRKVLNNDVLNVWGIYLQEYIKENILLRMDSGKSILSCSIDRLNEIIDKCGEYKSICELFELFVDVFGMDKMKVNSCGGGGSLSHVALEGEGDYVKVNSWFNKWLNEMGDMKYIENYPLVFGVYIDREKYKGVVVDIQKRIKPYNCDLLNNTKWKFVSAVCCDDEGYYCFGCIDSKWFVYDSSLVPSIREIFMDDVEIVAKIKRETVLLIYRLC